MSSGGTPVEAAAATAVGTAEPTGAPPKHLGGRGEPMASLLRTTWEASLPRLDYDPRLCLQRVVEGPHGYVMQLNTGRLTLKRKTDVVSPKVVQPFNAAKFHFGRVPASETIATFAPVADLKVAGDHRVLFNKAPIGDNHVLLLPFATEGRAQALTLDALRVAMSWCREVGDHKFRLGYNSLGAYASVNHLHFHGYFLQAPATRLPVEKATFTPIGHLFGATYGRLAYPIDTLAFRGEDVAGLAAAVAEAAGLLQTADVPYNLFACNGEGGVHVYIFPQRFGRALADGELAGDVRALGINPGAFELAGHLIVGDARVFAGATDAQATRLLAAASLGEQGFQQLLDGLAERSPARPAASPRTAPMTQAARDVLVAAGG